jgi:hypothetical protein
VHDAAVVARLVRADVGLLVHDDQAQAGPAAQQLAGHCEADDARADDATSWTPEAPLCSLPIGEAYAARTLLRPMRMLVTGASGAIGAELVPHLAREGHELRALARTPARVPEPVAALAEWSRATP